ncbi:MAG: ankyrin repeat domain-containing protein [Alphaproteobacteria bacterium]|nr:ankyrin repeat domain-containing protein [Alphaproteobacteria bacterium]
MAQFLTSSFGANTTDPKKMGQQLVCLMKETPDDVDAALKMIAGGADANTKNEHGMTPLMFAALNGHENLVIALLDKGARVNDTENTGTTALIFAAYRFQNPGHRNIAKILLEHGADPDIENKMGFSADDFVYKLRKEDRVGLSDAFCAYRLKKIADAGTPRKRRIYRKNTTEPK